MEADGSDYKREPEYPNFQHLSELLLTQLHVMVSAKDWYAVRGTIQQALESMFVEGLQEAKERIIANPELLKSTSVS